MCVGVCGSNEKDLLIETYTSIDPLAQVKLANQLFVYTYASLKNSTGIDKTFKTVLIRWEKVEINMSYKEKFEMIYLIHTINTSIQNN